MKTWKSYSLVIVLSVLATILIAAEHGPLIGSVSETNPGLAVENIATVDIEAVTNDFLKERGDLERLANKYAGETRALEVLRDTIESMNQESEVYPKDDPKYYQMKTQVLIKAEELKVRQKSNVSRHDREAGKLLKETYEKALKVVENYANEKKIDLVLLKQSGRIRGFTDAEVGTNILVRNVVFAHDQIDITDAIKNLMK